MGRKSLVAGIALATFVLPGASMAEDKNGWYIQLGAAYVDFAESATVSTAAGVVPGSNATIDNNTALAMGLGYRFGDDFSAIALFGIPPTTSINGSGTLAGINVGDVTYGPAVLALNYHIPTQSAFQPFIGGGINYTKVFESKDGGVTNLEVDDTFGLVLRAGFDFMIDEQNGVFFSANKVFASTDASGNATALAGARVTADIELDPLIIHAGWIHRF